VTKITSVGPRRRWGPHPRGGSPNSERETQRKRTVLGLVGKRNPLQKVVDRPLEYTREELIKKTKKEIRTLGVALNVRKSIEKKDV